LKKIDLKKTHIIRFWQAAAPRPRAGDKEPLMALASALEFPTHGAGAALAFPMPSQASSVGRASSHAARAGSCVCNHHHHRSRWWRFGL